MEPLLFLCHRLPFPPNKGDKVRSYHFLRHLAKRYRIFLGTFVDDPADWPHVARLEGLCAEVCVERLSPLAKRALSARALLFGEALTLPYFRSRALARWVRAIVAREGITRAFAFSSPMAQYLLDLRGVGCVADFVDLDSAKWDDYARRRPWPLSALYAREGRRLAAFEERVASSVAAVTFVTDDEARLFRERGLEASVRGAASGASVRRAAVAASARIVTVPNGVDSDYFSPVKSFPSPFAPGERAIVFIGAMDYWPNVDAAQWFAREILPKVRSREPSVRFHVIGMNPVPAVRSLASDPTVVVTGRVDDVRPFLQHASVVVAPLRVARGIQNKVLEAMAMAKAVVVTPASAASLTARRGVELEVGSEPAEFAARVSELLDPTRAAQLGGLARVRVVSDFAWRAALRRLDTLFAAETPAGPGAAETKVRTDSLSASLGAK